MTDAVSEGWKPRTLGGFIDVVGPLWTRREGGCWAYAIVAEAKHTNPAGIVHGGVLTTLLDHALSAIAWEASGRKACITIALDVQFLAAVQAGALVAARGRVVRQTADLVFMQGTLSVADKEIATGSAILKVKG